MSGEGKNLIFERRTQMNLTQAALAEMIGAHQQTINKLERGEIKFSRYMEKLEEALELEPGTLTDTMTGAIRKRDKRRRRRKQRAPTRSRDFTPLPLFSSMPGDEGMMVVATRHHGYTDRPSPLHNIPEAYGVLLSTAAAGYDPGDIVWLDPKSNLQTDRDVLLHSSDRRASLLARLLDHNKTHWVVAVSEFNCPKIVCKQRTIKRVDFPTCDRVIGRLCRL